MRRQYLRIHIVPRVSEKMSNPLDRSLDDIRKNEEVDDMVIEEAELDELDELGARLSHAYELSGEPPSLAAIEFAQSSVALPERTPANIARFNEGVRKRIDSALRESTGAPNIGAWVQQVRLGASLDEAAAAHETGVAVPAYRQFEAGKMPVWRLPAKTFARFCRTLAIGVGPRPRWASRSSLGARRGVYRRLDVHDDQRSDLLNNLAADSEDKSRAEFD